MAEPTEDDYYYGYLFGDEYAFCIVGNHLFEPDKRQGEQIRTFHFGSRFDKTSALIQFDAYEAPY